jgi:hypothetical protein
MRGSLMKINIFYSWQSDLPNRTNRGFIEKALEKAVKNLRNDESISVEPVIERDTLGVPGSPDIAHTILSKIDNCHIFIGDVSIINKNNRTRKTPNPNVMIELGYALNKLSFNRIIMVLNKAYGKPEELPFDLKMKRAIDYTAAKEQESLTVERDALSKELENQLRIIIDEIENNGIENENNKINPIDISLDYKTLNYGGGVRHDYQMQIKLYNRTTNIIRDYHVDIQFPKIFLLKATAGKEITERSSPELLFTRVTGKDSSELYPGDNNLIATFDYYVDRNNFQNVYTPENIVRVTVYYNDYEPISVEKPFKSIQKF